MKIKEIVGNALQFHCPGCNCKHTVYHGAGNGRAPVWSWNDNSEKPTLSPSILVRTGHYVPGSDPRGCWCNYNAEHPDDDPDFKCVICHSFVVDGRIQFLDDCTHALAGQTVDLPVIE